MSSEYTDVPRFLATREGEAAQAQFSDKDYGRVGDQRPYQIVQPAYGAPKFLQRYQYLNDALRECGTLCQLQGQPFKLVRWGARVPCYPCQNAARSGNQLPRLRLSTPGALRGFPGAQPIADFTPRNGVIVYGPDGQPKLVGGPNYRVSRTPTPPTSYIDFATPIPQRYLEAVQTAQYLAESEGRNAYVCSSFGASCNSRDGKKWVPVVYVQPGGLVKRYAPQGKDVDNTNVVTGVTEDEFRELIRQSEGASRLALGV